MYNNDLTNEIWIISFKQTNNFIFQKIASVVFIGIFGGITAHQVSKIRKLQKIIGEHNEVKTTIKDSQEFLKVVQKYVNYDELPVSEVPFLLHQFTIFHGEVAGFQTKIAKLKK